MNNRNKELPGMAELEPVVPFWAKSERLEYVMPLTELFDLEVLEDPMRRFRPQNEFTVNRFFF